MLRKALLVARDGDLAQDLGACLCRWGFEVAVATRGSAGLRWARRHLPDLVLLETDLLDADGTSACRELKLDPATNLLPVVLLADPAVPRFRGLGPHVCADATLDKPIEEGTLRAALAAVLALRDQRRQRGCRGELFLAVASDLEGAAELAQWLPTLPLFTALGATPLWQFITAVREVSINAIEWGHRRQLNRPIKLTCSLDAEKVTVVIRDTGLGFDPTHLPHAARADDPLAHLAVREAQGLREGGFGILLTRGLVDRLEYNASGTEATLIKYLTPLTLSRDGPSSCGPAIAVDSRARLGL
jgi:anti-sigma regulatory factor (Ser/Thr protein kinase)/CheY-like chemotaxis protein